MAPSTSDATSKTHCVLTGPSNWTTWHYDFRMAVLTNRLNAYFDGKEELLKVPPRDVIAHQLLAHIKIRHIEYARKHLRTKPITKNDYNIEAYDALDNTTDTEGEEESGDEDQAEEKEDKLVKEVQTYFKENNSSLISAIENHHRRLLRDWTTQDDSLTKVRDWMNSTVSTELRRAHFHLGASPREWYNNIKTIAQSANLTITNLRERIQAHNDSLRGSKGKTSTRDALNMWIAKWEGLINEAIMEELPDILPKGNWFPDFVNSIRAVIPHHATFMTLEHGRSPMNHHMAAEHARIGAEGLPNANKPQGISRGAFHGQSQDNDQPRGKKRGRNNNNKNEDNSASTKKAKHDHPAKPSPSTFTVTIMGDDGKPHCGTCGMIHRTPRCFYLFPELVPAEFNFHTNVQERVDNALKANPRLKEQALAEDKAITKPPSPQIN
ncbi:hypothetical protein C8A05DRAFT_20629 [Staphylotrichum tortipilum]|uniref:Gag protein n=1 Tax=Staphylotrichum tortipilum TaxID=2831512 RepID=A0AAN6M9E6_9PEZI|nr:hypothetical protein C8A05DRAFT_20629 [Staphylotrichum longicolle]